MSERFDIIVIGGGPAGLTAAVYARRAGRSVLVLEKESIGGQIASSPRVDNFPAVPGISGAELAQRLYAQAEELGARVELEEVLELRPGSLWQVVTDYGAYEAQALILAAGMRHRTLQLPGEDTLQGISYCAVCDGAFYAGKDVAVCGGGNTAVQDALFLSEQCRSVTLIHRRDRFRADPILVERLGKRENIRREMNASVAALLGEDGVLTGLVLRDTRTGSTRELPVSGLFEAVGQLPQTALAADLAALDEAGFILAGEDCVTRSPGVFAAGDCRKKEVRQLTTACADGAVAALAACRFCEEQA